MKATPVSPVATRKSIHLLAFTFFAHHVALLLLSFKAWNLQSYFSWHSIGGFYDWLVSFRAIYIYIFTIRPYI